MHPNTLYSQLIGRQVFILSPHFDDAVLSCGQLLHHLHTQADITVVNIFTQSHNGPYTFSAKKNLASSGKYSNALDLYAARKAEDQSALSSLGVKVINLGLTDSLFRRRKSKSLLGKIFPEIDHLYPTYRWHVTKSVSFQDSALHQIQHQLQTLVPAGAVVLLPANFAGHVDHQITCQAGENLFSDVIYYSEFPYPSQKSGLFPPSEYFQLKLPVDKTIKNSLIKYYSTQIKNLFPNGQIPHHYETYFWRRADSVYTRVYHQLSPHLLTLWQTLWQTSNQATYANSPQWFLSAVKAFCLSDVVLVTVYLGSRLISIAPLIKSKKFGLSVYSFLADDFNNTLPFLHDHQNPQALNQLINTLQKLGVVAVNHCSDSLITTVSKITKHYSCLPVTINRYLDLKSNLQNQIYLRLQKNLSQSVKAELEKFTLSVSLGFDPQVFDSVLAIDHNSIKQLRGYNTFSSPQVFTFYQLLAKNFNHHFGTFLLNFEHQPVAYLLGFTFGKTFFASQTAYLPQFSHFAPGKKIFAEIIKYLSVNQTEILDFGSGDNQVKRSVTSNFTQVSKLYLSRNYFIRHYLKTMEQVRNSLFNIISGHRQLYFIYRRLKNFYV